MTSKSIMMNKEKAKKIMMVLDRINQEIDFLGKVMAPKSPAPQPVRVKNWHGFGSK